MALQPGNRLGPYEILNAIGAGGMGEVYKARDTRLGRTVAIKVLPAALAGDPVFRERFTREAKAISQLNHPHICTLYDIGEVPNPESQVPHPESIRFLVMEYLEGETLAERLKKGALPIEQALRIAIEMADALSAADRAGITHRDVKPGNVMLTKAGSKLLDFGLAKTGPAKAGHYVRPRVPAGDRSVRLQPDPSAIPTMSASLTAQGTILGTFQYMAPEQLEGHDADARTDIFAFGAVLYEMVTGKRAFEGKSQASLIHAIMGVDPPPMASLQPLTPAALDRVVQKCLAKEPDERWQSAKDLHDELKWIAESGSQPNAPAVASQGRAGLKTGPHKWAPWVAAAVFFVTTLTLGGRMYLGRSPVDPNVYRSTILPPAELSGIPPLRLAISPDGRSLVFVAPDANGHVVLWVRVLDGLTAQPLAGTEGAGGPFWSPDSRFIAFTAGGKLKRIDVSGGSARTLADTAGVDGGTWNRDDVILFKPTGGPIYGVSAAGGTSSAVTALDDRVGEDSHRLPSFLPDGRHFLYTASARNESAVYVGSLDSMDRTRLMSGGGNAKYAQGFLLFMREATLMAQPFDADGLTLTGEPTPVAEGVVTGTGVFRAGAFSVSDTGALVYATASPSTTSPLVWFDRVGAQIGVLGDQGANGDLEVSPDGTRAAVSVIDPAAANRSSDIWIVDVARRLRTRFTSDPASEITSAWSPDGSRVAFNRARPRTGFDLYRKASNGAGNEDVLLDDASVKYPESWSSDGRFILYAIGVNPATRSSDLWVLPLFGDRKPYPFLQSRFNEDVGKFSPDGRWVAFPSDESGRYEVYVTPFPGPGGKVLISTAGGHWPRWRRNGTEIFYVAPDNKLMAATVNGQGANFEVGPVKSLFDLRPGGARYFYDVSPDGQRFLVIRRQEQPTSVPPISLVVNWAATLRK
ncbi:MAG: hypothetical protein A3G76_14805 [Acidobacteria bacterium RIFCSPLOWO2_12_FULL_65_11]|nr:MAG: hypothetical protein A3H95_09110 [Acidobacteria bacterium RIFCSPLOWO2_02_FULL_64_15]OFW30986.1 MAG: hypothetical protein A3G76_14805 [Acidobacteria bacterium RIFCSPLOWO2_12_FULL_65_11]